MVEKESIEEHDAHCDVCRAMGYGRERIKWVGEKVEILFDTPVDAQLAHKLLDIFDKSHDKEKAVLFSQTSTLVKEYEDKLEQLRDLNGALMLKMSLLEDVNKKAVLFYEHLKNHPEVQNAPQNAGIPVCKLCGKTADEIAEEKESLVEHDTHCNVCRGMGYVNKSPEQQAVEVWEDEIKKTDFRWSGTLAGIFDKGLHTALRAERELNKESIEVIHQNCEEQVRKAWKASAECENQNLEKVAEEIVLKTLHKKIDDAVEVRTCLMRADIQNLRASLFGCSESLRSAQVREKTYRAELVRRIGKSGVKDFEKRAFGEEVREYLLDELIQIGCMCCNCHDGSNIIVQKGDRDRVFVEVKTGE